MIVEELVSKWGIKTDRSSMNRFNAGLKRMRTGLVAIGAVGIAGAAAIIAITKSATKFGDDLAKTAQKVGVTTNALQKLRYAASLGGVGTKELTTGLMRLSRTINEARQGTGEYVDVVNQAGISSELLNDKSKSAADLIAILSDKFKSMPDGVEKTAIAMDLFGRSGASLIPMLNQGSKEITKMYKEAEDLGLIFEHKLLVNSEKVQDNFNRMGQVIGLVKNKIGLALAPAVNKLMEQFLAWYKINQNFVASDILAFLEGMGSALTVIYTALKGIGAVIGVGAKLRAWLSQPAQIKAYTAEEIQSRRTSSWKVRDTKAVTNNVNIQVSGTADPNITATKIKDKLEDYLGVAYGGGKI